MKLSQIDQAYHANGTATRMVDMLILTACRHGATRWEFRTIAGKLRDADIIDNQPFEFPPPPESIRANIFVYLQLMCGTSSSASSGENAVQMSDTVAKPQLSCESNRDAVVTMVSTFTPTLDYARLLDSFRQPLSDSTKRGGRLRQMLLKTIKNMNAQRTKR